MEKCTKCHGSGMQTHVQQLGPGMVQRIQTLCGSCSGQGEYINPKDRCKNCHGKKVVRERKLIEVHIDKGIIKIAHAVYMNFTNDPISANNLKCQILKALNRLILLFLILCYSHEHF